MRVTTIFARMTTILSIVASITAAQATKSMLRTRRNLVNVADNAAGMTNAVDATLGEMAIVVTPLGSRKTKFEGTFTADTSTEALDDESTADALRRTLQKDTNGDYLSEGTKAMETTMINPDAGLRLRQLTPATKNIHFGELTMVTTGSDLMNDRTLDIVDAPTVDRYAAVNGTAKMETSATNNNNDGLLRRQLITTMPAVASAATTLVTPGTNDVDFGEIAWKQAPVLTVARWTLWI